MSRTHGEAPESSRTQAEAPPLAYKCAEKELKPVWQWWWSRSPAMDTSSLKAHVPYPLESLFASSPISSPSSVVASRKDFDGGGLGSLYSAFADITEPPSANQILCTLPRHTPIVMASTGTGGSLPPNFLLTPQQQSLLFAALNSNKQSASASPAPNNGLSLSATSFKSPASSLKDTSANAMQESPFLDAYDYDFGDSSFDFSFASANGGDQPKMIGDLPGSARSDSVDNDGIDGNDGNDKRSHPDDEDDEDSPGNDAKRHETSEKVPKKPGRKPLTSEPSSKRKAQNRAAQRAFRERKEKHVKDLETKVEELQKVSDAASNENSALRNQIARLTTELNQYKQKMAVISTSTTASPAARNAGFGQPALNKLSDVSFQFEFPKFGMLPGPASNKSQRSVSQPISPQQKLQTYPSPENSQSNGSKSPEQQNSPDNQLNDLAKFSSIFTPSMSSSSLSRGSLDSANFSVAGGNTSSPSASSHSNMGPSSSCGTSPEPFTQSPMGSKPIETLTTIGEEQPSMSANDQPFAQFGNVDLSSSNFDWLSTQNGGQFDPQLFGDYREPQENVLSNTNFDEFFNDAVDFDFLTPYNTAPTPSVAKRTIIDEIDAQKDSINEEPAKQPNMHCTEIWDKIHALPKAQNGDFDLDGLCSELTKKAKCSGSGPVVGETDFDTILKKYMGKEVSSNCVANSLGIEVSSDKKHMGIGMP
ncbi:AP1-like transcription factor [Paramyrothecium foliicola]|nr:AP1-like transcription factor [Paramyrothecium foliicola]